MLSLLTCSVSRFDDFDPPFAVPSSPLRVQRRVSKSLGFTKTSSTPRKRRVAKMTIGRPTDFRHELHLGKEVVPENMVTLWDTARWEQELKKDSRSSLPSSIAPSIPPSSPTNLNRSKRNSITPQKRKPVPSLIPDIPPISPTAMVVAPHAIPLPPSPTESTLGREPLESEPETFDSLLDPPRRSSSIDEGEAIPVSKTMKVEYELHCEIEPAPKDVADDH